MLGHVVPVLFVVAAWFVSTGVVIMLDRLPPATFRWSLGGMALVAAGGLWLARHVAADVSPRGAYLGFAAALAVWGWHEMSFLMGIVTGPRREPLPFGTTGWTRFRMAAATLIWHEIALAATAVAMLALTWGQPNQVAGIAFAILFAMRVSAKLNIFLGVPNLTVDFLPAKLVYLKSYFRVAHYNPLFPVSVAVGSVAALLLGEAASVAAPGGAVGCTMLAALVALGVLEHWFLVLPMKDAALWRWAMSTNTGQAR
jgi:putative photosynthetic complex assembly protein 2